MPSRAAMIHCQLAELNAFCMSRVTTPQNFLVHRLRFIAPCAMDTMAVIASTVDLALRNPY